MKTIAIIDEERNAINDITAIINELNLNVSVTGFAQSTSEAHSLLKILKPDIIIAGVCLPEFDGLSLIEYVKPFLPNSAYIIVSECEDYKCVRKALSLGVLDYLNEPLTEENMGTALEKALHYLDSVCARLQYDEFARILRIYHSCVNCCESDPALLFNALDKLKTRLSFNDYKNQLHKLLCAMTAITLAEHDDSLDQIRALPSFRELSSLTNYQQLDALVRNYIGQIIDAQKRTMAQNDGDALTKARIYIEENYNKDISLEKLAEIVHMNPTYFSVVFKKSTGMTYVKYITALRIEKSKHLLEEGHRVTDICSAVGYNNYRYFCSVFKKATGLSPSSYRERARDKAMKGVS